MSLGPMKQLSETVSRRTVLKGTTAALGASVLSRTGAAQNAHRGNRNHGPRLTAHRGYQDVFPQNTVAAVEGTSRLGADRIEIDIQPSADGEIVVFHDRQLDDLTDKEGVVTETSSETVLRAEVLDTDETVPTLTEVFDAARPSITMNVEFKGPDADGPDAGGPGVYTWREFAREVLDIASQFPHDILVSSFSTAALEGVRAVNSEIPVAKLFGDAPERNLEIARELDAEAINPSQDVLDDDLVTTAHDEGRDVNVYTLDNWRQAREPIELGVDGLIADYPSVHTFSPDKQSERPSVRSQMR